MSTIPPFQMSDHDLLIRIDTRLERVEKDVKEGNDRTYSKLENHELRLRAIEDRNLKIDPLVAEHQQIYPEWVAFRARLRAYMGLVAFAGALLGFGAQLAMRYFLP